MANRTASISDVTFYSASYPIMQTGDIILDTPFATTSGKKQILISNLTVAPYSNARLGANIWISSSLNPIYYFSFANNASQEWAKSDIENPVTFRPLGGKVRFERLDGSNVGFTAEYYDIAYSGWDGEISGSWGLRHPRTSAYADFGFVFNGSGSIVNLESYAAIRTNLRSYSKGIFFRGIEASQGFATLRVGITNTTHSLDYLIIDRCYLHDTSGGEGIYIGMTGGSPRPIFRNMRVTNTIFARIAKESIQSQQVRGGEYKNFIISNGAASWKYSGIGGGQANAVQLMVEEGKVVMKDFVIDGTTNGFILFGWDTGSVVPRNRVIIRNGVVNDFRDIGYYIHNTANQGLVWEHRDLYFGNANNTQGEIGDGYDNFFISRNWGTDKHLFDRITVDTTKGNTIETLSSTYEVPSGSLRTTSSLIRPVFKNWGFPGKVPEQIEYWVNRMDNNASASYKVGDIVHFFTTASSTYFYECKVAHTSSIIQPLNLPTTWSGITWDSNGIPSYWTSSYNSSSAQYSYPPDDFRLTGSDFWNSRGMGLYDNDETDDYTNFRWYIADDSNGTNSIRISNENSTRYEKRDKKDIGKYIRLQANFKDQAGNRQEVWITNWTLVT